MRASLVRGMVANDVKCSPTSLNFNPNNLPIYKQHQYFDILKILL
jgi:hypothetical protein